MGAEGVEHAAVLWVATSSQAAVPSAHADLERPVGALEPHLAANDLVEADVAVGGLDVDGAEARSTQIDP